VPESHDIPRLEFTQSELEAEAARRFGPDPLAWSFQCPNCGDVAQIKEWPAEHRGRAGQECLGRILAALRGSVDRGCDWTAYGLIPGPWTITRPEGEILRCFPLADPAKETTDAC
jgi:hypothetical protein